MPPSPPSRWRRPRLESAEATLANAVLEHDRAKNLFDKGALPRQRLDAAQTAHRAAVAQRDLATANLAQANAALRRAREVQRDTTITSPVTGFVVERNYDAGAIPGDKPIVVVADLREMKLEAGVSEARSRTAAPGHEGGGRRAGEAGRDVLRPAGRDRAGSRRAQPPLQDRRARAERRDARCCRACMRLPASSKPRPRTRSCCRRKP